MQVSSVRRCALAVVAALGVWLCSFAADTAAWAQPPAAGVGASNLTIAWQRGKCVGRLGTVAEVEVPEEYQFAGQEGTAIWLQENGQRPSEKNLGVLLPSSLNERWFLLFTYEPAGYVRDDEKKSFLPDALLATAQMVTEANNPLRAERNLPPVHVQGWILPPTYDEQLKQLTWITQVTTGDQPSMNFGIRVLGRGGVMMVNLVAMPTEIRSLLPTVKKLVAGVRFLPGHRYADFQKGDPVSNRSLASLITGEVRAAAPAAAAAATAATNDRLANQVIMVLLGIGAVVLAILIYRLIMRMKVR